MRVVRAETTIKPSCGCYARIGSAITAAFTAMPGLPARVVLPECAAGEWRVTAWNTSLGRAEQTADLLHEGGPLTITTPPVLGDLALALQRRSGGPSKTK